MTTDECVGGVNEKASIHIETIFYIVSRESLNAIASIL